MTQSIREEDTSNHSKSIIELLHCRDTVKTNENVLTCDEHFTVWRKVCDIHSDTTHSLNTLAEQKFWVINNNDIKVTDDYFTFADRMILDGHPNSFMPDNLNRFTHFPTDA